MAFFFFVFIGLLMWEAHQVREEWQKKKTSRGGRVSIPGRLRKRGRKRNRGGRMSVPGRWATRLRKSGKKKSREGTCECTGTVGY